MKKILLLSILSLILVSCNSGNTTTDEKQDETKPDIQIQTENNETKEENHLNSWDIVDIYQNGEKVEVQVLAHGDHYHIIFDGVEYSVSAEEYQMLFEEDNQYILGIGLRTEMPTIVESEKHGDHWHVKYSDGSEDILDEDPAKLIEEQENSKP